MKIKSVPKIDRRRPIWWITETQQQEVDNFDRKWRYRFVTVSPDWDIERKQDELIECVNHLANPDVENSPFLIEISVEKAASMGISEDLLECEISRRNELYIKYMELDDDQLLDTISVEVNK